MKVYQPDPIEMIEWTFNDNFVFPIVLNLHHNFDVIPFIAKTTKKGAFRLTLLWSLYLKNKDQTVDILTFTAQDIYMLELDGDDEWRLRNLFENSWLRFKQDYNKRRKSTQLTYEIREVDMKEKIKTTLQSLQSGAEGD